MHAQAATRSPSRNGSVLVITVVMLAFAGMIIASILTVTTSYTRNSEGVYARDKATFLADSGLNAALVKLNALSDANINITESRTYFAESNRFVREDWGFTTELLSTNGQYFIRSTGRYDGYRVTAESKIILGAGSSSIHALYAHAVFAGNSANLSTYTLKIGGTSTGADFVKGDTYSGGKIELTGTSRLRHPEIMIDTNSDGICDSGETWTNAFAVQTFTNPLSQTAFNNFNTANTNLSKAYNNGRYDFGEAFVDTIGNGVYDPGEPYTDSNGNGQRDNGDSYIDRNSNGVYNAGVDTVVDLGNGLYDAGEEWVEDSTRSQRRNGKYDPAGGYYLYASSKWTWKTSYKVGNKTYYCTSWPAEQYEDVGDGVYSTVGEPYTDQNGIYDVGEQYVDDRNDIYDYGTQARGTVTGMPAPGPGQRVAAGGDAAIDPPNLTNMYYNMDRNGSKPIGALARWGNDVVVSSNDYGTARAITTLSKPEHIFVRNPPTSGSVSSGGKTIYGRSYAYVTNSAGKRLDDYFLEDPADSTYNTYVTADEIDGTVNTAPSYLNVTADGNNKLYFVDGNVYLHHPQVYSMRFRNPGTRITIVANGNITLSDEFYYNADYSPTLTRTNMNSTVVNNPSDALCLIALKNPAFPNNTGNIFIGDSQFGTGGSIHAMLYAENDFVDNNLNTADQAFISIFGNMTAGNQIRLNRTVGGGQYRTRLDVTLDERIRDGTIIVPGLPHAVGTQRSIFRRTAWHYVPGTWFSSSFLK
jgi:hypothetical protein